MSLVSSTEAAQAILETSLHDFCGDFNQDRVTPILEADVAGYLYHRIVTNGCPLNMVYLATRVCGEVARTRKPDIVIGKLNTVFACVSPLVIAELKVFQRWGHSAQQMGRRFAGLIGEDLPSLAEARSVLPNGRTEIIIDLFVSSQRRGYLTGSREGQRRRDIVVRKCREVGAGLIWIHPEADTDRVCYDRLV